MADLKNDFTQTLFSTETHIVCDGISQEEEGRENAAVQGEQNKCASYERKPELLIAALSIHRWCVKSALTERGELHIRMKFKLSLLKKYLWHIT